MKGWKNDRERHILASKGIRTTTCKGNRDKPCNASETPLNELIEKMKYEFKDKKPNWDGKIIKGTNFEYLLNELSKNKVFLKELNYKIESYYNYDEMYDTDEEKNDEKLFWNLLLEDLEDSGAFNWDDSPEIKRNNRKLIDIYIKTGLYKPFDGITFGGRLPKRNGIQYDIRDNWKDWLWRQKK